MTTNSTMQSLQYDAIKKSVGVAYLLWFFTGAFGGHRFYLKKNGSAVGLLALTISSYILIIVLVGFIGLIALGIWLIVDAFLIPGMVQQYNLDLINRMQSGSSIS
jgi:TM2 domain-containing membrane protein YozV